MGQGDPGREHQARVKPRDLMRGRVCITLVGDGVGSLKQPHNHHLAQLNIGRIRYEIEDPRMANFTNNLALVNGFAEGTPGFVWRYNDESGNSTSTRPAHWAGSRCWLRGSRRCSIRSPWRVSTPASRASRRAL